LIALMMYSVRSVHATLREAKNNSTMREGGVDILYCSYVYRIPRDLSYDSYCYR
jgi:hypothetical protein